MSITLAHVGRDQEKCEQVIRGASRDDLLEFEEKALYALDNNDLIAAPGIAREHVQWVADLCRAVLDEQVAESLKNSTD